MTTEIKFTPRAYCKIVLHAAKYPHCAINGILLAESSKAREAKKGKPLVLVDAIPLFHLCLHVSPMAEIALMQIDSTANLQGLVIAGYYFANEILDDMSIDKPSSRIADKIVDNFSSACLVVVDNRKITLGMDEVAVKVMQSFEGKWKTVETSNVNVDDSCLEAASVLLMEGAQEKLNDFDNHLDDLTAEWINLDVNKLIELHTTSVNHTDD